MRNTNVNNPNNPGMGSSRPVPNPGAMDSSNLNNSSNNLNSNFNSNSSYYSNNHVGGSLNNSMGIGIGMGGGLGGLSAGGTGGYLQSSKLPSKSNNKNDRGQKALALAIALSNSNSNSNNNNNNSNNSNNNNSSSNNNIYYNNTNGSNSSLNTHINNNLKSSTISRPNQASFLGRSIGSDEYHPDNRGRIGINSISMSNNSIAVGQLSPDRSMVNFSNNNAAALRRKDGLGESDHITPTLPTSITNNSNFNNIRISSSSYAASNATSNTNETNSNINGNAGRGLSNNQSNQISQPPSHLPQPSQNKSSYQQLSTTSGNNANNFNATTTNNNSNHNYVLSNTNRNSNSMFGEKRTLELVDIVDNGSRISDSDSFSYIPQNCINEDDDQGNNSHFGYSNMSQNSNVGRSKELNQQKSAFLANSIAADNYNNRLVNGDSNSNTNTGVSSLKPISLFQAATNSNMGRSNSLANSANVPNRSTNNHSNTSNSNQTKVPDRNTNDSLMPTVSSPQVRSNFNAMATSDRAEDAKGDADGVPQPSMCFSFYDGKVTSLAASRNGCYIYAAFSSGRLRLFDMVKSSYTEPEDRFGYLIGKIDANSVGNALVTNLQIADTHSDACGHLFLGCMIGSTHLHIIDLNSIRDIKRKRGFFIFSSSENGKDSNKEIKTFNYSDSKLHGLTAVKPMEVTNADLSTGAYTAKYHLFCGKGYISFNIWDVTLEARTSSSEASGLEYNTRLVHLISGLVNGPSMSFGAFVNLNMKQVWDELSGDGFISYFTSTPVQNSKIPFEIVAKTQDGKLRSSMVHRYVENDNETLANESASLKYKMIPNTEKVMAASADGTIFFSASPGNDEFVVMRYMPAKETSSQPLSSSMQSSPSSPTSSTNNSKNIPSSETGGQITITNSFSLSSFINEPAERTSKRSRTFREITKISNTPDGLYAIIICSDNSVFLYSQCDIFESNSIRSSESATDEDLDMEGEGRSGLGGKGKYSGGFLTLLFRALDVVKVEVNISYADLPIGAHDAPDNLMSSSSNDSNVFCPCHNHSELRGQTFKHIAANKVLITVAYLETSLSRGDGTILVGRLKSSITHSNNRDDSQIDAEIGTVPDFVPTAVCHQGVGLVPPSKSPLFNRPFCGACMSYNQMHWPDFNNSTKLQTESSDKAKSKNNRVAKQSVGARVAAAIESAGADDASESDSEASAVDEVGDGKTAKPAKVAKPKKTPKILKGTKILSSEADNKVLVETNIALSEALSESQNRVGELETRNSELENRNESLIKKFDKRLENELVLRRKFKIEFEELKTMNDYLTSQNSSLRVENKRLDDSAAAIRTAFESLHSAFQSCSYALGIQPATVNADHTSGDPSKVNIGAFYCVICQDYLADCVINDCGHVCLCYAQATHMTQTQRLKSCPVCKQQCHSGFTKLSGIERYL